MRRQCDGRSSGCEPTSPLKTDLPSRGPCPRWRRLPVPPATFCRRCEKRCVRERLSARLSIRCALCLASTERGAREIACVTRGGHRGKHLPDITLRTPRHVAAARGPAGVTRNVASPRVRGFGTSVFSEMSRLATQHGAVNLGQGFPDFPSPSFVKEAAKAAIDADLNQYAVSHGAPRLRTAIARTWNERYGMDVDPDREITVTSGATEAIFDAVQALAGPGDEIVVFEPFYDSYLPSAIMAGGARRSTKNGKGVWKGKGVDLVGAGFI